MLGGGARYLTWIHAQLGLKSPALEERPELDGFAARAEDYIEEILAAWHGALHELTPEDACRPVYPAPWGTTYCIDAMLEHAVMHPLRHAYQLERLMRNIQGYDPNTAQAFR